MLIREAVKELNEENFERLIKGISGDIKAQAKEHLYNLSDLARRGDSAHYTYAASVIKATKEWMDRSESAFENFEKGGGSRFGKTKK